jgi:hypothetical protein
MIFFFCFLFVLLDQQGRFRLVNLRMNHGGAHLNDCSDHIAYWWHELQSTLWEGSAGL